MQKEIFLEVCHTLGVGKYDGNKSYFPSEKSVFLWKNIIVIAAVCCIIMLKFVKYAGH